MKFSTTLEKNKIDSIAIGGFDGLHKAHQYLVSHLDKHGALVVIEKKHVFALTPDERRCEYTKFPCVFLNFEKIKDMQAKAFLVFLKAQFPSLKKIVVGYDFRFGKNRVGSVQLLQKECEGEVIVIDEQKIDDISIHSRSIKTYLQKGNITLANRLLGRPYAILGKVIKGQGLGAKALYATFNLDTSNYCLPKEGVYLTQTVIQSNVYPSLTFIGKRASTDGAFSIETHILNQSEFSDVKNVEVIFIEYLRENQKFVSLDLLKAQITKDIMSAKIYFGC